MTNYAILITGASGGLGTAIVNACLTAFPDHAVIASDITPEIESTIDDDRIMTLQLDVTNEDSIAAGRKKIEEKGLRVWGLVNNAGVSDFFPICEKEPAALERMFAINTFGPVNMVRGFLSHLIETKGHVVNISSESVRLPAAFHPYANTKIALEALSVSMRNELELKGAKLSIIRPGAIDTPFLDDLTAMKERIGNSIFKKYLLRFSEKAPKQIRRIAPPEEVAAVVVKALKKPKRIYTVNNNPMLRIAQWLPARITDRAMKKMLE